MAMTVEITLDLATMTSCIDPSVRIVTKSPKAGPLHIFSISLGTGNSSGGQQNSVPHVMDESKRGSPVWEDFVYHTKWNNEQEAFGLMTVCTKFPNMHATNVCFVYI
jgi:hypothetical protein